MEKSAEPHRIIGFLERYAIPSFKHVAIHLCIAVLLLAIFFWFVAYQALEALFTLYAWEVLGIDRGPAAGMLLFVALPFIIMAFPAGILGSKLGRRITIKIGLVMFIIACFVIFFTPVYFHDLATISMIIIICFIIAGCGWAFININSIVIVWSPNFIKKFFI